MHRIEGLTDDQLRMFEDRAEAAIRIALQLVMDTIADRIGKIQTASARQLWDGCARGLHDRHDGPCP